MRLPLMIALLAFAAPLAAQIPGRNAPEADYDAFMALAAEVKPYRSERLISIADFNKRKAKSGALILDARSEWAYKAGHIKGAVNLPFSDFDAKSLAKVIGDNPDREILIYCNNNFNDDVRPVILKTGRTVLTIPTFIGLYAYGYKNIWELKGALDLNAPEVEWVKGSCDCP
jgi:phage shock protein E